MKLVSFDIGIRNLAVCVLEGTSRTDMVISHWDVIDVVGEKNGHARTACYKCSKPAMWIQTGGAMSMSCSRHRPKNLTITKTALGKKTIAELQELGKTYSITGKTKKDLVAAISQKLGESGWKKFKGNARAPGGGVLDLVGDIVASLDKRDWWTGADLIIFENQLDRRMFAVQAMLHMYFACRGYRTKGVSAIHKLDNVTMTGDATGTYRGRKKTGIVHCEALCPPTNMSYFKSHKKKDDLADSFLAAVWVLEHPAGFMRDS